MPQQIQNKKMTTTNNNTNMTDHDIPNNQASSTKRESAHAPGVAALHPVSGDDSPTATQLRPADYETVCKHQAGHAVMRWLCKVPARPIGTNGQCKQPAPEIEADGKCAHCHGTGRHIPVESILLITLAGIAAEKEYGLSRPVFETAQDDDIVQARAMLREHRRLSGRFVEFMPDGTPYFIEGDRLLEKWFDEACDKLRPYSEMVDELGRCLEMRGTMNTPSVAARIRELSYYYEPIVRY